MKMDLAPANAFGYTVGILLGFLLNKRWTFRSEGRMVPSFLRYLFVLAVAYAANLATVILIGEHFNINPYLDQALGIVPYTAIGFLGSRYFAFPVSKQRQIDHQRQKTPVLKNKVQISRPTAVSIVVPCYNEEAVLAETTRQLADLLRKLIAAGKITPDSRVYYVDDGSSDSTWSVIEDLAEVHEFVHGIKLSRNRGHQNALLSGLLTAEGEVIISVDADLQDDLSAIEQMMELYCAGYDIVYGVRASRDTDTLFKSFSAIAYYKLLNMMGVEIIHNHADYRLLSRRVIEALKEFGEVNLFLRAIIPQLGFSYALVSYDRAERFAGESKYPLKKMLAFAWEGITSFSDMPLRLITGLGLLVSMVSLLLTIWVIVIRLFTDQAIPGWSSTVLPIYFLGGVQLLCFGIMGEYLAKIYAETKRRPRYIIEKMI
jgi:glycosyltransferase involved in cell wall biosynthesis